MASLDAVTAFLVRLAVDLFNQLRSMGSGGETVMNDVPTGRPRNIIRV